MAKFACAVPLFAMLMLMVAGCAGPQVPCSDIDPVGPCATSHSHTYDGGRS